MPSQIALFIAVTLVAILHHAVTGAHAGTSSSEHTPNTLNSLSIHTLAGSTLVQWSTSHLPGVDDRPSDVPSLVDHLLLSPATLTAAHTRDRDGDVCVTLHEDEAGETYVTITDTDEVHEGDTHSPCATMPRRHPSDSDSKSTTKSRQTEIDPATILLRYEHRMGEATRPDGQIVSSGDYLRWSVPSLISHTPDASTPSVHFRYSLFGEWDQPTTFIDSSDIIRIRLERYNIRICELFETDEEEDSNSLECDITHMPRNIEITYTLLVECDSACHGIGAGVTCRPALSPAFTFRLPLPTVVESESNRLESASTVDSSHRPASDIASAHVFTTESTVDPDLVFLDRIANDTDVRADLAYFYSQTNGPSWSIQNNNWLNPNISVCDWVGISCDVDRTMLIGFDFSTSGGFQMQSTNSNGADLSGLTSHITTLQFFNLASNSALCIGQPGIDLSQQVELNILDLDGTNAECTEPPNGFPPVRLPYVSYIQELHLSQSSIPIHDVHLISFPNLTLLDVSRGAPFPIAGVMNMPLLTSLTAIRALESITPDRSGRVGGALTHEWLGNLTLYNPYLSTLDMTGLSPDLIFDLDTPIGTVRPTTNFPIIHSDTLTRLSLTALTQLYTDENGVPMDWLAFLPSLKVLTMTDLPLVTIPTVTFHSAASTQIQQLTLSTPNEPTPITGTIEPLFRFSSLRILILSGSSLSGSLTLGLDLASYWPHLEVLMIQQSPSIGGILPTLKNLSNLTTLFLTDCGLIGFIPKDFLVGSTKHLSELHLEGKSGGTPKSTPTQHTKLNGYQRRNTD